VTVLAVRAPLGWLGPGRVAEDVVVVVSGGRVAFAGSRRDLGTVASRGDRAETLGGAPFPPSPEVELEADGFLMPAVADRHVHLGLSDPGAVLARGVTLVRDLGWPAEAIFPLAEASESPAFNGPLVRAAGPMLTCPGGYPTQAGWAPPGTGLEVRGPEEGAAAVRDLAARGAAVVKVALNAEAGPTLPDETLLAICDAAHGLGLRVTAHCQGRGQVERALGAGVDELAHCPWTERLSDQVVGAAARRMRVVSTLDIHSYGADTPELRTATDNLRRFLEAGGRVVYGTDLGNGPIPPGIHAGEARHLARAGLSAEEVLAAMVARPLAPGEPGDLVVVGGDPREDLGALDRVVAVVRGGRVVRLPGRGALAG
jgi:imidazolonepropionase-like amidohydrolase